MPQIENDVELELNDIDDLFILPLTDMNDDCYNASNGEDADDDVLDTDVTNRSAERQRFRPLMTLKQRRRSLLSATSLPISIPQPSADVLRLMRLDSGIAMSPRDRWRRAVRQIRTLSDPWAEFALENLPTENARRHRYNALKKQWIVDNVKVKMESEPFNHGAMRACYRLKKLARHSYSNDWKQQAHNYVAKCYMEDVAREVYFEDVRLQMDAKLWGEEFNRHKPPKKVDVLQMSILEFVDRPGKPLFHLEHFIDGHYIKYNSNSGFVEENIRLTPQAFSHFTFERSGHRLIVVDIQGVGDLWTDPQVHTCDGNGYGDGNLGTRGMALFFHSHICNPICESLKLSKFDLALSERLSQQTFIRMQRNAATRLRGIEEMCCSVSPSEAADLSSFFYHRSRCISSTSSGYSGEDEMILDDREHDTPEDGHFTDDIISPPSSLRSRNRKFLSESDDSSHSATVTEEEERSRFQTAARLNSRPSCVAHEMNYRNLQQDSKPGSSILGEVHHCLAKYHDMGRFIKPGSDDPVDINAALFHEQLAANLGVIEAVVTLACIYLQRPHGVLESITVEATADNEEDGVKYMLQAAEAGDRGAMVYLAKAYESGDGLGIERAKSYREAVKWYQKAAETTSEDDSGEFDGTVDDPLYQLKAAMARLYLDGGFDLDKDPSYAGELYNEAAEGATAAMKGRLASQYYTLAEEAWALVEE